MKIAFFLIVILIVGTYTVGRQYTHEIRTSIQIDANDERVWQHLANLKDYSKWNPFIQNIEGQAVEGAKITVSIAQPKSEVMTFEPTLLAVEQNKELRWRGQFILPGLFDGEHYFKIWKSADGNVHFIHGEIFSGALAWLLLPTIKDDTKAGFVAMNKALKLKSES